MSKIAVTVIGAGGKMGTRTSTNLAKLTDKYDLTLVENAPKGIESIRARGLEVTPVEEALAKAEVVIFAVPDTLIKKLSAIYVPMLKPGTGFLILDPAAAVAKELSLRDDCTFGVAHPCHPSFLLDQDTPEARAVCCDLALVPVGGTYTLDAAEAARMVNAMAPKAAREV